MASECVRTRGEPLSDFRKLTFRWRRYTVADFEGVAVLVVRGASATAGCGTTWAPTGLLLGAVQTAARAGHAQGESLGEAREDMARHRLAWGDCVRGTLRGDCGEVSRVHTKRGDEVKDGKNFDNVTSRATLTRATDELARIRRRIARLDAAALEALDGRLTDLEAALMHAREAVRVLADVRSMRGR